MDDKKRFELITRNTEEVLETDDLKQFIETGAPLNHYIGFEISGKVHLGTGLMSGLKTADFQKAKVNTSYYLANWHAWMNNKLGGDFETIQKASKYFEESMKIALEISGGDSEKLKIVTGDQLYHNNDAYWQLMVEVSKNLTLKRALRAITIMGRKEGEDVSLAGLVYAPMQVADIFAQDINIAHAGLDQRKAQVIAREVGLKLKMMEKQGKKPYKPVAIHHHLILGLQKPAVWPIDKEKMRDLWSEQKMSKSIPGSAIFIDDSEDEIRSAMKKAFCPEGITDFNPVLDWAKYLVFNREKAELNIERQEKFGGNIDYTSYSHLEKDFAERKLHPMDLKAAMAEKIVKMLEPARMHFKKPNMQKLKEEFEKIKVTR